MVGAVCFVEAGNVWPDIESVKMSDLRVGVGTGLRVNSPLGILRLDCGINVDRRSDESKLKWSLSIGQAF